MRTATIALRGPEFAQTMSEMRAWLDQQLFEPLRFTYNQDREIIVIAIDFQEDHHAEAFQSRFAGRQGDVASLLNTQKVNRAALDRFGMPEARGTMAEACWWRLVAEEIRTEADNFGSESAKETMEIAARSWERLAEELEQRMGPNGVRRDRLSASL